jgi:hypothetical protein
MLSLQVCGRVSVLALATSLAVAGAAPGAEPESGTAGGIDVHHVTSIACEEPGSDFAFTPLGVGFGLLGELYVIDPDNSRVFVLSDSLSDITLFARCPSDLGDCQLVDVETDGTGDIYVSERTSGQVLVFDRLGEFVSEAEAGEGLTGIGLGRPEQVYAAMGIAGAINLVDLADDGETIECPISGSDGGSYPVDCLAGNLRDVFVTDAFSGRVLLLSPLGRPRKALVGFDFASPFGLASYRDRCVLVSDSELGLIAVFTADGGFLGSFGEGFLGMPTFVACRDDGIVCVADADSMSIEVFRIETSVE